MRRHRGHPTDVKGFGARGVSMSEYALLIGVVALAVASMSVYCQRSFKAVLRAQTDDLLRIEEGDVNGEKTQRKGASDLEDSPIRLDPNSFVASSAAKAQSSQTQQYDGAAGTQTIQGQQQQTSAGFSIFRESRGEPKSSEQQP